MHKFFRSVGFQDIYTKKGEEKILKKLFKLAQKTDTLVLSDDTVFVEYQCELAPGMGVCLVGVENQRSKFELQYYFPYLKADQISSNEECSIQRHTDRETYGGMLEEYKVGISLIFYMMNSFNYRKRKKETLNVKVSSVNLSGLSIQGKILLPIQKTERQIEKAKVASKNRHNLIEAAKHGDEEAMETLTIEDIDLYTQISRRLVKEDVYSIVESCFMPCGIECDQYSIIGEIKRIRNLTNSFTQEQIYKLTIECNDILFDVGIHKEDLLGEPEVGRRFKGQIWLMGEANFQISG